MTATTPQAAAEPANPVAGAVQVTYAGFWRRSLAFWLDLTLIGLVTAAIMALVSDEERGGALALLFVMLYFVGLTWHFQGTLAKLMLGLRVVSRDGETIGFWRAALREAIGKWVVVTAWLVTAGLWLYGAMASSMPAIGAGVFVVGIILLSPWRGWMWHDRMAGSVVVYERIVDEGPMWANDPPWLREPHALSGPLIGPDDTQDLQPLPNMPPPTGEPLASQDEVIIPPADPGPFSLDDGDEPPSPRDS